MAFKTIDVEPFEFLSDTIEISWQYTPVDFFEESVSLTHDFFEIAIEAGKAKATLSAASADAIPNWKATIYAILVARFDSVQIINHKKFHLSESGIKRTNGTDVTIELSGVAGISITGSLDLKVFEGCVLVKDSQRERLDEQRQLASRLLAHNDDPVLQALRSSFRKAVEDPRNEFVYLYEIREAISTKMGGELKAREQLKLSKKEWGRLGQLCCHLPVVQGRHRGAHATELRNATPQEIDEARAITRKLLLAYLDVL